MLSHRTAKRRPFVTSLVLVLLVGFAAPSLAQAASEPVRLTPEANPEGSVDGPCGLAVDASGLVYVSDYYHDRVQVFERATEPSGRQVLEYVAHVVDSDSLGGPCGLAVDGTGRVYANDYHRSVRRYTPSSFPVGPGTSYGSPTIVDPGPATGVAVDPATGHLFVNERTHLSEYDASGAFLGQLAGFGDGYGLAVSPAGELYLADAATDTVKVFDASGNPLGSLAPPAGFSSLRDSALAIDHQSGVLYVLDDTQPEGHAEQPRSRVYVFSPAGAFLGHLPYDVIGGSPAGVAVDDSVVNPGSVYLTSGNADRGDVYAYPPDAETSAAPRPPASGIPVGGEALFPGIPIGSAAPPPGGIPCEGDACQALPPEPVDPTLTTLLEGRGNPAPHYMAYRRNCAPIRREEVEIKRRLRRLARPLHRLDAASGAARRLRKRRGQLRRRLRGATGDEKSCRRSNRRLASPSLARISTAKAGFDAPGVGGLSATGAGAGARGAALSDAPLASADGKARTAGLLPGAAGFDATVWSEGALASEAGSHPYSLELSLGLDQGSGEADLRDLRIDLPPGFLVNPAAINILCSKSAFATARTSPYEASLSGESCPDRSQVGTIEVERAGGQRRRFGLFELSPQSGAAFALGASPFGRPLLLGGQIRSDASGTYFSFGAAEVPASLQTASLSLTLWGAPWDASHDTDRGNCLNEATPSFPWSKCPIGDPAVAFLTLPTECGPVLSFSARASSWQQATEESATAGLAPLTGCGGLGFEPKSEGLLSVAKASSSSGFVFRFSAEDPGLADPRRRIHSLARGAAIELPEGVTLNPSLGAGLETCSAARLAEESAFNPPGAGCPNGSKIGAFRVRVPFYEGLLSGGVYLAKPYENPFGTLLAVYLVVKSADRGILIAVAGKLLTDPTDGSLTASFEDLPQLPYTDLEVELRSGQRAPLVSPLACGAAATRTTLTPWAAGAPQRSSESESQISSGIDFGLCPDGSTPPFSPGALAGGVNSNVGSYTPYYVHLTRRDTEQEIISYSLVLPKGIAAKLAGVPFCSDPAIEMARKRSGTAETADPSCPAASQVGHTDTGYGVGVALTYAPGRIYLAGPYHGAPLSLVTVNAATVGPFDLGTIVIRSAFQIDPHTAQLRIDSAASDPIPHIVDGIPLHLRDIRIYMDRPRFTHNPSSCEPSGLESTLTGSGQSFADPADDSRATATERFQLLNCLNLGFRPKLGLRLLGGPERGDFPSLRAGFVSRGDRDSNLKRLEVVMPHALFIAQQHIRTVCTKAQFSASACPVGSVYGKAVAHTQLFDEPLRGNVYLRSSSGRFPDLVAELHSGSVRIVLTGAIGSSKHGGVRAYFDNLPDAPIERFTMTLFGGWRGLLQNSTNICANPPVASVKGLAQNNIGAVFTSRLRGQCGGGGKQASRRRARG